MLGRNRRLIALPDAHTSPTVPPRRQFRTSRSDETNHCKRDGRMKVGQAVAEIMKREGIEILCGYPVNHLLEYAAAADIRPIIVRQERIGIHMADAISRVTSGRKIGAFCMQHGPGTENAYGGVAQAFSESIPILVVPGGYPRRTAQVGANYYAARDMRGIAKIAESITSADEVINVMRRAMSRLRNGRGGPA